MKQKIYFITYGDSPKYSISKQHILGLARKSNFFEEARKKFDEKKLDESKFLFQRDIVFNPKNANSYLYLAKIYNFEENQKEEEKNIKTVLLLNPANEEAIYMLMKVAMHPLHHTRQPLSV